MNGAVDAKSLSTAVRFEYGVTSAYDAQTAEQPISAAAQTPVSVALTNLQPATTYHYRLIARGDGGSAQSADRTFATSAASAPPPPPVPPACSNGRDDDRDGFADADDPRCHSDTDPDNARSYQPQATSEARVDDPVLVCSADQLALVSAEATNGRSRIRLRGVADPGQAGERVGLYAAGRRVASTRVRPDGSFAARARAAPGNPNTVRYQARLGPRRSQSVVAQRRFAGLRLAVTSGRVVLRGHTVGRRPRGVELLGRGGGCGPFKRLATLRVRAGGRFTLTAAPFAEVDIATYRVRVGTVAAAGTRESTPPQAIALR